MSLLRIRNFPDPVLRVECQPVEVFDSELESLVTNMVETMYAAPGIGLAAPQVGLERRIFVIDLTVGEEEGNVHVFVNPEIVESSEEAEGEVEGCLSIPDFSEKVTRPERVVVRAKDAQGESFELAAEGLLARAIQHENDHLNGVLFVDHLRGIRRERAKRRLKKLATEQALAATTK